MGKKKKKKGRQARPVALKKQSEDKIIIQIDPVKRKMSPQELKAYLRENKRGTGPHGLEANKTKRRKTGSRS